MFPCFDINVGCPPYKYNENLIHISQVGLLIIGATEIKLRIPDTQLIDRFRSSRKMSYSTTSIKTERCQHLHTKATVSNQAQQT